ncbi:serine/threonine-protein kinase-like protein CR4 [Vigna angularis]|uniref:serine/threonine-protein kinase-like protein CR4 n=1 Tax=Phaseolus angularis TaxID=3914 RepID=UPI000809BD58|nr:serine/threonine-protein kinase-like protein CR4 [Vigna angularis]
MPTSRFQAAVFATTLGCWFVACYRREEGDRGSSRLSSRCLGVSWRLAPIRATVLTRRWRVVLVLIRRFRSAEVELRRCYVTIWGLILDVTGCRHSMAEGFAASKRVKGEETKREFVTLEGEIQGVLKDGIVVAIKRAIVYPNVQKNSKEFHTELDLLSRLNNAHLLNLLGYCEEGEESSLCMSTWLMAHSINTFMSSNILIDEEHNARVADFGLSLLGPADSSSPLAELPVGTLGYLDPEYYKLHYLTKKFDVCSFGVLLLEILSDRKAIDMQYEEGNIIQWAVPLIKSGDIASILDPVLKAPSDVDALMGSPSIKLLHSPSIRSQHLRSSIKLQIASSLFPCIKQTYRDKSLAKI